MTLTGKLLIATAAVAAFSGSAMAADLYVPPAAAAAPVATSTNWDGPYIGATLGYGWGTATATPAAPAPAVSQAIAGGLVGAQIGYNFHVADQFVLGIDWAPTILDIAGIRPPSAIQGTSMLPLLKNNSKKIVPWRNQMYYHYYEFPQPHHVYPHFGIRTMRYKLIRFYGGADAWELYDLEQDPRELHNIYADKKNAKLVSSLKTSLRKLIVQFKDDVALQVFSTPVR